MLEIRQGIKYHIEYDRLVDYINYFWNTYFSEHFKEGEQFLFMSYMDERVQKAIDDHWRIKKLINNLASETLENHEASSSELAEAVNQHVRHEERILFPHLEKKLSDEQLEMIGKQISDEPLNDNYEDNF